MHLANQWRRAAGAVLIGASVLLAACADDDGNAGEPGAAEPTPTIEATSTPTPGPTVASPASLGSYRYAIVLETSGVSLDEEDQVPDGLDLEETPFRVEIDGEVVNPDRHRSEVRASLGFIELALERVQVGDRVWSREAGGEWRESAATPGSDLLSGNLDVNPNTLFGTDPQAFESFSEQLRDVPYTEDEVNGVPALRYDFDAEASRRVFADAPGLVPLEDDEIEPEVSLWLAEATGVPVRLMVVARDEAGTPVFETELNLSDLDDPGIEVEPPADASTATPTATSTPAATPAGTATP